MVVAVAEQDEVVDVGGSAELPGDDVVGVGAGGVDAAVGERAVLVASFQGSAQAWRDGASGAAEVEDVVSLLAQPLTDVGAGRGDLDGRGTGGRRTSHGLLGGGGDGLGDHSGDLGVAEDPGDGHAREQDRVVVARDPELPASAGDEVVEVGGDDEVGSDFVAGAEEGVVELAAGELDQGEHEQVRASGPTQAASAAAVLPSGSR